MRKQFFDRTKPESFVAIKRVAMENKGRAQQMILSTPTQVRTSSARPMATSANLSKQPALNPVCD